MPAHQSTAKEREKRAALKTLHRGGFIDSRMLIMLCHHYGIKVSIWSKAKLLFMNEFHVSITVLRHKSKKTDLKRSNFDGVFTAIENLIAVTIDQA